MEKLVKYITAEKLIAVAAITVTAAILIVVIRSLYKRYNNKYEKGKRLAYAKIIESTLRAVIIIAAVISLLKVFGFNPVGALAGLGIAGAVVGLALQDLLKDVIMGVHIMSDNFFTVGDCVTYKGQYGIVTEFSMTSTKIKILENGSVLSVCNRNIDEIIHVSGIINLDIPLPYSMEQEEVHRTLREIALKIKKTVLVTECSFKGTQDFGESAILYRLELKCDPEYYYTVNRLAKGIIQKEFEERQITVPFNQLDVHVVK